MGHREHIGVAQELILKVELHLQFAIARRRDRIAAFQDAQRQTTGPEDPRRAIGRKQAPHGEVRGQRSRLTEEVDLLPRRAPARGQSGRELGDPAHARDPRDAGDPRPQAEARVPPEDLVASQTGEHHGETDLSRGLGDEIAVDAVDRRLVHRVEDPRNLASEVGSAHANLDVLGADAPGDALRILPL